MKTVNRIVGTALAVAGLAMGTSAFAQHHGGGHHFGGGHFGGHGHFGHGHFFGPRFSFAFGVPLFWPSYYYWGSPYYPYYPYYSYPPYPYGYGYDYAPAPYGDAAPEQDLGPAENAAPGPGAPSQGPLYMNYCASAKAYYPKVTQCPEGWKFISPSH